MNFEITIKTENSNKYQWLFLLLVLINVLGFWYFFLIKDVKLFTATLASIVLLIVGIAELGFKKSVFRQTVFLFFLFLWMTTNQYYIVIIPILFYWLEYKVSKKKVISFNKEEIRFPSFFEKQIQWDELSNVILKDNLLTIDYKNNKLFQSLISSDESKIDEIQFNEFCNQQLNKAL